jgi:23S rRNA pseudouridine955/2504/2580 synthase
MRFPESRERDSIGSFPPPLHRRIGSSRGGRSEQAVRRRVYFKMKTLSKAPSVVREVIGEEQAGQRIDNFLLRVCKGVPKSHVYRILRSGEVRANGKRIDPSYRLAAGDEIRIPPIRLAASVAEAPAVPLGKSFPVIFEDGALIALDKPAGTAVHGGSGVSFGVIEQLRRQRPQAKFLELAHRLDRETSGLLLIGKKRSSLNALHDMFRSGEIRKRYLTLVSGRWMNPLQHIRLGLTKYLTEDGERRVSVDEEGKPSHSIVRLRRRWENFSLLEVELRTGRTHQIRVHLSHLGFPLAGDDKYGNFALNKDLMRLGLKRMFLHAARLEMPHPTTGAPLALASPLPDDLARFIARIGQNERCDFEAADGD